MSTAIETLSEGGTGTSMWDLEMYLGDHALMTAHATGRVPIVNTQSAASVGNDEGEEDEDTDEEIEEGMPDYDEDEEEDDDTDSERASS